MKKRALLMFTCSLMLASSIQCLAQDTQSVEQQKSAAAARAEQERKAAAKAAGQEERDAARAAAKEERIAVKDAAQEKRAAAKAAAQEKRETLKAEAEVKRTIEQKKRSSREAERKQAQPDGTFKLLGARSNFSATVVVKGAPYSASASTEHIQTLGDGNQIIQKNEATHYRDSEGRMRIEQKLRTIGKWTAVGDPPTIINLWDPVAGDFYSLDPRSRTALKNTRPARRVIVAPFPKTKDSQFVKPDADKLVAWAKEGKKQQVGAPAAKEQTSDLTKTNRPGGQETFDKKKKKEPLGTQMIEGVAAEGTRLTLTIPAGEIGNVLPIEIVDESWYSPDLQIVVMSKHHDPRSGDTVYRLTNINRNEPDRSFFEVPAEYRIVDRSSPKPSTKKPEKPTP
ncbi:MAG: hypothetical protein ACREBG_15115 [Pyrinomonadaceae bacterium]